MANNITWFSDLEVTPWWQRIRGYPPFCKREVYGSWDGNWVHTTYFSMNVRMDNTVEIRKMEKHPAGWVPKVYACDERLAKESIDNGH